VTAPVIRLQVQAQGPADLRSVTVTSVHPLALEHTPILRAHFGVCGRIVRATVLRDQATGEASDVIEVFSVQGSGARAGMRPAAGGHVALMQRKATQNL
jgi:hypothetical protein